MLDTLEPLAQQDDRLLLTEIYQRDYQRMMAVAMQILASHSKAEDAVHEAFLAIAQNISKISDPMCKKTKAYVVTIVENKAIDQLRRRKRRPTVPLEDWQGIETQPRGESPLADCMLRLPAVERQLLWLKYYQGYELKEIGPMLGLSYDAVTRLHRRAKEQLRELYEKERSR